MSGKFAIACRHFEADEGFTLAVMLIMASASWSDRRITGVF